MAHPKIEPDVLLDKLFELFRETGYDGATLSQLAEAAGLQKASLYHRFPGGKEQMAARVMAYADEWLTAHILAPLRRAGDPETRLQEAIAGLNALYDGGRKACLLRALSLGAGAGPLRPLVAQSFEYLIAGFAQLAQDFGSPPASARRLAERAVVQVQGALVVGGAFQTPDLFQRTLQELAAELRGR